MADPKHPVRGSPPELRTQPVPERRSTRDIDNPTAQFPIGAMYRELADKKKRSRAGDPDDTALLDWEEEDTDEVREAPEPKRRVTVDLRFFALWLAAAGILGLLAAVAAAAALLYR